MSKNYVAQVVNSIVDAIFVADYAWAQDNFSPLIVDLGPEPLTVAIGYTYDPTTNTFTPPPTPEADDE